MSDENKILSKSAQRVQQALAKKVPKEVTGLSLGEFPMGLPDTTRMSQASDAVSIQS